MISPFSSSLNRRAFAAASASLAALAMTGAGYADDNGAHIDGPQGKIEFYQRGASGDPILFLHSDAGRAEQWKEVIDLLDGEFQVAALDFRGHGASEAARNGDYSFSGRGEDALAVADYLGWRSFLVVAHSGGSAAALAMAGKHPHRVRGLLLVDPATDPRAIPKDVLAGMVAGLAGSDSLTYLKQYYLSIAGPDKAVQARVLKEAEATTPESRAGLGKAVAEWNPETALDGYAGPMMILGTDISDGPHALYALRPNIPHEVIRGTGHWLQVERPQTVADAIRKFALQTRR